MIAAAGAPDDDARSPTGSLGERSRSPSAEERDTASRRESASLDRWIALLATRQHGVVSRGQLVALGLSGRAIEHRLARGRLHLAHRGVYFVGHPVEAPLARETAALFACGDGAVLSHTSAATLWGIRRPDEDRSEINVTVTGGSRRRRRIGLAIHVVAALEPSEVDVRHGLTVTSPVRTLVDLASVLDQRDLARCLEEAQIRRLLRRERLRESLDRRRGARGTRMLRELLNVGENPSLTRSEAERLLLDLVRAARLPRPETNVRVGGYEIDALWSQERLAVEVDGYAYHRTRAAFERDRRRDADLQAAGLRVMRITWLQLTNERDSVVARLAQALVTTY